MLKHGSIKLVCTTSTEHSKFNKLSMSHVKCRVGQSQITFPMIDVIRFLPCCSVWNFLSLYGIYGHPQPPTVQSSGGLRGKMDKIQEYLEEAGESFTKLKVWSLEVDKKRGADRRKEIEKREKEIEEELDFLETDEEIENLNLKIAEDEIWIERVQLDKLRARGLEPEKKMEDKDRKNTERDNQERADMKREDKKTAAKEKENKKREEKEMEMEKEREKEKEKENKKMEEKDMGKEKEREKEMEKEKGREME